MNIKCEKGCTIYLIIPKSINLFAKHPVSANNIYMIKEKNPTEYILLSSVFLLK